MPVGQGCGVSIGATGAVSGRMIDQQPHPLANHHMLDPVVLIGPRVRLEPLSIAHVDALAGVGLAEELWRFTPRRLRSAADIRGYVEAALQGQADGTMLPFVIVVVSDGTVAGSTRYGNIDLPNRRLEIGWTWLVPEVQRTGINHEVKYLLLRHAFEELGCVRVEFKTDALNRKSRDALIGIGAVEEGTLRKHVQVEDGRVRDTVYYSIVDDEWPAVKQNLEESLVQRGARVRS